jgi:hypothetical protein
VRPDFQEFQLCVGPDCQVILGRKGESLLILHASNHSIRLASRGIHDQVSQKRDQKGPTFPEDDPDMMLLIMCIIHMRFDCIPTSLGFQELVDLTNICAKYHCPALVVPWIEKWVKPHVPEHPGTNHGNWLFIALTFGLIKIFADVGKHLVLNASYHLKTGLLKVDGQFLRPPFYG